MPFDLSLLQPGVFWSLPIFRENYYERFAIDRMHIFPRGLLPRFVCAIATQYDRDPSNQENTFAIGAISFPPPLLCKYYCASHSHAALQRAIGELPPYPGLRKPSTLVVKYWPAKTGPYRGQSIAHFIMPSVDLMDDLQQRFGYLMAKLKYAFLIHCTYAYSS